MTSSVSICSNALLRLGANSISSFQDSTKTATLCSNLYPTVRDGLLRAHPWNCARKRVLLAPLSAAPAFDYPHQFQLPADWVRTIQIGPRGNAFTYTQEGRLILAFPSQLPLVYVFANLNEATWDNSFVDTMTAAMTKVLALPITQSASAAQVMATEYDAVFKAAKSVNGQDADDETFGDFPLIESRLSSYSRAPGR